MCNSVIIQSYYTSSSLISFTSDYQSAIPGFAGTFVNETVDFGTLFDVETGDSLGTIQFNNINRSTSTFPASYNVTENISIQLNGNTAIFALNYYKSTSAKYVNGEKYIIPIISATGDFVGKKGYIVIDAFVDRRLVTISLDG